MELNRKNCLKCSNRQDPSRKYHKLMFKKKVNKWIFMILNWKLVMNKKYHFLQGEKNRRIEQKRKLLRLTRKLWKNLKKRFRRIKKMMLNFQNRKKKNVSLKMRKLIIWSYKGISSKSILWKNIKNKRMTVKKLLNINVTSFAKKLELWVYLSSKKSAYASTQTLKI